MKMKDKSEGVQKVKMAKGDKLKQVKPILDLFDITRLPEEKLISFSSLLEKDTKLSKDEEIMLVGMGMLLAMYNLKKDKISHSELEKYIAYFCISCSLEKLRRKNLIQQKGKWYDDKTMYKNTDFAMELFKKTGVVPT